MTEALVLTPNKLPTLERSGIDVGARTGYADELGKVKPGVFESN